MAGKVQIRRDTSTNWSSANTILSSGEMGFETDTNKLKIGNGTNAWNILKYFTDSNLLSPGPIGNTAPNTGNFTTITTTTANATTINASTILVTTANATTINASTITTTTANATTITAVIGTGFQNMVVQTSGTGASWSLPTALQVSGTKFKVTMVGGGGQGGGTPATAGHVGNGGGSGSVCIAYIPYVSGQNSLTYTVGTGGSGAGTNAAGNPGTSTTIVYNGVTYYANNGTGGATSGTNNGGGSGGVAAGGTLNLNGNSGDSGGVAAATAPYMGYGAITPMGFGGTPTSQGAAGTGTGVAGTGYGSGGSGGKNGATATARAGGVGANGIIIIEY